MTLVIILIWYYKKQELKKFLKQIIFSFKEYDPDFCSKYGTGTEVETYVIDDGEDYYDYKNFAGANMWWGQFIWVTEKPGFFTGNEDPSKYVTQYFLKISNWNTISPGLYFLSPNQN